MRIFVAWSENLSHAVAKILRVQIPAVVKAVTLFVSSEDIRKGKQWFSEISRQLRYTNFGIVCLTAENLQNHWIHFEAGALAMKVKKTRLFTVLINCEAADLPLSAFQHTKLSSKEDVWKLIREINGLCGKRKLPEVRLKLAFGKVWPVMHKRIEEAIAKDRVKEHSSHSKPTADKQETARKKLEHLLGPGRYNEEEFLRKIQERNEKIALLFVDAGINPDSYHPQIGTALTAAIRNRMASVVRVLIENHADVHKGNALFTACAQGDLDSMKLVVGAGGNVNARDSYGMTPLLVIPGDRADLRDYLISKGADPNAKSDEGHQTPKPPDPASGIQSSGKRATADLEKILNVKMRP